jgi:DNA-binding response OmpR family regulator
MSLELIQIIQDGHDQAQVLDQILRKASFRTNVAFDGATGIQDIWRLKPALVLLDLVLPGMSGRDLCARLRTDPQTRSMGIIFVTALGSEDHRVAALDLGADDVISKPYSSRELVARVKAVLRRVSTPTATLDEELDEELTVEETQYVISFRGTRVVLSHPEWTILLRLAKTAGKVVPGEELRSALWGEDGLSHDRELERTIQSLNKKLAAEAAPSETISGTAGTGYRLTRKPRVLPLSA